MGGAIYNTGTLAVSGSTFSGDYADSYGGAISTGDGSPCGNGPAPSGRATITDSTFSNNSALYGGAISNGSLGGHGVLTITASAFSHNGYDSVGGALASYGGAIANGDVAGQGSLSVSTSSFLSNTAWQSGSAIDNGDIGQGSLTVSTSTFAGNIMQLGCCGVSPSGAIANGPQPLTVTSSTFAYNATAIDSNGPLTLAADILAVSANGMPVGAYLGSGPDCRGSGAITDAGYNVDDDGSCGLTSTHSISDSAAIDGALDPTAGYGGPTPTIRIISDPSDPAYQAIPAGFTAPGASAPVCAQPDQRGVARPTPCSMGAYEPAPSGGFTYAAYPQGGATGPVTCPLTSTVSAQCSFSQALGLAGPGDTVLLAVGGAAGVYSGNDYQIDLAGTSPTAPLTIKPAPGVSNPILDAGYTMSCGLCYPVFYIANDSGQPIFVTMQGFTIRNGNDVVDQQTSLYTEYGGGAITNLSGQLTVTDMTFSGNMGYAGAISNGGLSDAPVNPYYTAALTATNSTFSDNHTYGHSSGAISGVGANTHLTVSGSTFSGNVGVWGAIANNGGTLVVSGSTFSGNDGAIANSDASDANSPHTTVTGSTFSGNDGTIANNGGTMTVTSSSIISGTNDYNSEIDGAIENDGTLSIASSTIAHNSANYGAIVNFGELTLTSSTLADNTGSNVGGGAAGAIFNDGGSAALAADVIAQSTVTDDNGNPIGTANCAGGAITDAGYNVDDDGSCGLTSTHSISDSAAIDGYLGPLGDHGGPTLTIPLLGASNVPTITAPDPAFAAIPADFTAPGSSAPVCAQPDQRGQPRTAPCDMGAFELPPSTITLSSSANPAVSGQPITITATISPTPDGGTVAFDKNSLPGFFCPAAPVDPTTGTATCSVTYSAVSAYPITATFSGAAAVAPATSAVLTQSVTKADSAVTVSASANPVAAGQPVTYTATVSARAPGSGDPEGGTLTFMDGAAPIPGCDVLLNGLYALTCTTTFTTAGSHAITAVYSGDPDFNPSTSDVLTETVSKAPTTLALSASANPVVYGQPLTLTATISTTATGQGAPTGTVSFQDGGSAIAGCASQPVDPTTGTATCSTSALGAGSHSLTASYSGDGIFVASDDSAAPLNLTVNQAAQAITFTSTPPSPALTGGSYTVAATGGASGNPVTFSAGPASVCTSGGTNGATISFVGAGTCTVTASQAGNQNYQAAPSVTQSITVSDPLTLDLSVTSSPPGPVTTGSTVTASFTLTNHTMQAQTLTLAVTLSYQGNRGSFSHTVTVHFPLKAGQTLSKSMSFTIQRWFPRGTYTMSATATDTGGDSASGSASFTVS